MDQPKGRWWRESASLRLKRAFDVIGASTGLVLASPLIAAGSIATKLSGPILFSQPRAGYKGTIFTIHKFRTMRSPREDEVWFRTDAARVTKLGHLLRKTSIDELPELWNVLRGDMSLVGPRPLLVEYLEKYTDEESKRHLTPPGITGWAQVNGRQNIPFSERLRLDVWYVENRSFLLDCKILLRTITAVLFDPHDAVESQGLDAVDDIGLSSDRARSEVNT